MAKVLVVPDLHCPYTDLSSLTLLYAHIEAANPDVIIQLGDAMDMYSFSKFPRSHNVMTPKQELEQGIGMVAEFWKTVNKVSLNSTKAMLLEAT